METGYELDFFRQTPRVCCRECRCELFCGEVYYDVAGCAVCRDCLPHFARRYFGGCRRVVKTAEGCR